MQCLFQRITIPVNQKMRRDAGAGLDILRRPVVYSRMTDPSLNSQVKRYRLRPTCTQIGDSQRQINTLERTWGRGMQETEKVRKAWNKLFEGLCLRLEDQTSVPVKTKKKHDEANSK